MTAPTPSPKEPRIVVRPQYVRLGAVLIALETSKSLREALRAVHDLKAEQFDDAALLAPLRAEVARLRAALQPFARMPYSSHWADDQPIAADCTTAPGAAPLTIGDFRAAAKALAPEGGK